MGRLQHPHVLGVKAHRLLPHGAGSVILLELAPGGELLGRVLRQGHLSDVEARHYFAQIASAVEFMHGRGVVHLDLKLENVLLAAGGAAKLCDFGLAHEYERDGASGMVHKTRLTELRGSRSYVAPEVLRGCSSGYDGEPADIWSLGVMLFAMLAGFFPTPTAAETEPAFLRLREAVVSGGRSLVRTAFQAHDARCHLAASAIALVDHCLAFDPDQRPSAREVVGSDWLRAAPQTPPTSPATGAANPATPAKAATGSAKKGSAPVALANGGATLVGGGGAVCSSGGDETPTRRRGSRVRIPSRRRAGSLTPPKKRPRERAPLTVGEPNRR